MHLCIASLISNSNFLILNLDFKWGFPHCYCYETAPVKVTIDSLHIISNSQHPALTLLDLSAAFVIADHHPSFKNIYIYLAFQDTTSSCVVLLLSLTTPSLLPLPLLLFSSPNCGLPWAQSEVSFSIYTHFHRWSYPIYALTPKCNLHYTSLSFVIFFLICLPVN